MSADAVVTSRLLLLGMQAKLILSDRLGMVRQEERGATAGSVTSGLPVSRAWRRRPVRARSALPVGL